jgi:spermidine/putrescine transport system permease protein
VNIKKLGRLVTPYVVWLSILVMIPLVMMVILSFFETRGLDFTNATFTLSNWFRDLRDPSVLKALENSFTFAGITVAVVFLIGYPMAFILARSSFANKMVILMLTIIPMWSNSLLRNNALRNLFSEQSFVNDLLSKINLSFVLDIKGTPSAIIAGLVLTFLPFMILPVYTVLEKMDKSLIEASMDLGASPIRTFFKVTFPLSLKGVATGVIMVFLPSFSGFAVPYILGDGKFILVGTIIENSYNYNINFVSTLSILLVIIIFLMIFFVSKVDKEGESFL